MDNGRWTMDNGQWIIDNWIYRNLKNPFKIGILGRDCFGKLNVTNYFAECDLGNVIKTKKFPFNENFSYIISNESSIIHC